MHIILLCSFVFLHGFGLCISSYAEGQEAQSDVQAPAYVPAYLKNQKFSNANYSGRKVSYAGTKTGYAGTKTGYTGTKTGYTGTKSGYTKSPYGEKRSWDTNYGHGPTYEDFHNSANQPYMAKCVPDCLNNGICVATNTCQCPANYRGQYCELERKPCLVYPPLPMNSNRTCSSDFCTIQCLEGHKFIDGSTVANMRCVTGQWMPTRADFITLPDCLPECAPRCENGGVCLALNTCQCPEDYRGPQCQYAASVCDMRKLAFNGGYSCFGDADKFSCKLNCPAGASYSSPRAPVYACRYDTGVFEPQPIPHCVFNDAFVVVPSNYRNGSSSYYESHTWQTSSEGHSSSGHGGSSHGNWGSGLYHHSQHSGQSGQSQVVVQDFTPKGGTCLTWAGVHYKTFDGKIYSFKSPCRHILVRDLREHRFAVAVRPGACARRGYCPSEITVYLEEKPYVLSVHPEDNSVVFRSSKRLIPIPASLPGIRVAMPADHVIVNLDAAGLTLKWDTNDVIVIESSVLLWNNTEGLCGSLNSNMDDDLTTKEGTRAQTTPAMASSWQLNRIEDICESNPMELKSCSEQSDDTKKKAFQFCTTIFSKDKFRKCSAVMDVSLLLAACQGDYCACTSSENPEECACSTVSVHARECLRHGVEEMKYWRDPETCPKTCSDGKLYRVCGSDAQPTCAFPQPGGSNATCVEGCFCPDGLLLEAGRCIPKEECPCRLRNKSFKPGKVIPKDCNTCKCSSGAWSCTQAACGARCGAAGDPHYTTFDGRRYDFMGRCTYTLLQTENVTIEVENVACSGSITEAMNLPTYTGEGKPSCTKAVNLIYEGANIHLKQGGLILVNGREVSALPVSVAGVRIRAASSLFIIVQLPMKMDLWWDGNTRVFVDVPAEFQGKTKGLCGTFNLNQKDDFLTPEGDVEQSTLAFANKWKTREFCADLDTKEPEHPCKANMENKEAAEKYCSKLKSKLFEECHWYVDVEPYYDACLYDMCACAGDVTRCLCPLLGNYAMDCAKAGVRVQWRYNVKECELQCTGGQEYTVCADSCLRTCTDVALAAAGARCKPCCVEGCACPAGQVLDDTNACVPQGLCPCNHKGMKFDAGYKEVRAGSRERELCTCVGARWECVPATDGDVQNYPPAEDLRANCSAADHKEFTTCELEEPLTCKNMHLPPSPASMECRPGCQCKQGFVLESGSGRCVAAERCPCHHGGRSYPDGRAMQEECNQCVCKSGNWSCTSRACAGVCAAWGDSHVDTFDAAAYDFEGVCTYLLAKGCMDSSDGFDVEIQNVPCGTTGATCSKTTTLKVGGGGGQEVVALTKDAPLPDVSKLKRIKLRVAGAYVFLDVPSLGVSLQWDRGLRVYVRVDAVWRNRVKGLCGNYNGDTRDDFQTPAGGGLPEANALVFADAWKLKAACPKPKPVTDYCVARPHRKEWAVTVCGSMKRHPFSLCASEVPAGPYVERCERDACACDSGADCDCACAALAAYAYACSLRGVTFDWRSQQLCPMQCDEECSNYDGCVSACPLETCDNTADYTDLKGSCQLETCVEGCKPKKACPEGSVYSNHTLSECVPRAKCKPVCMTLEDGTEVLEGEVIEEDACHTCRCSKEHKVCTGQPCSTETVPPEASSPKPHDEPLKCISGWSPWVSVHTPTVGPDGASLEQEPLPKQKDLQIGSPMCSKEMMTDIECRTKVNHEIPKQTGLDAECSLERGLLCRERGGTCPDFEIRVLCECEPFQCLNATRPSYQHPRDCAKFYECTPDMANPTKPHTVLKSCSAGTLYNPATMICDWPAAVYAVRPECADTTVVPPGTTPTVATKAPTSTEPSTSRRPSTTTVPSTSTIPSTSTEQGTSSACPAGMAWADCAYPCDQLCEHFKETLLQKGVCAPGEKCVAGCVQQKCEKGFRWRDEKTCVPIKDCTCYSDGKLVKPGGVVTKGCVKCQCLANEMHCDSSDCISTTEAPNHLPIVLTTVPPTTVPPTTLPPTTVPTTTVAPTTVTPLIVKNTASPPPECAPDGYKYLLWGSEAEPQPILSASSEASAQFAPEFAVLDGRPNAISAGSWNPASNDVHQYLQVELPRPQPLYGVVLQGSPLFDQFVTSYQLMFSDDGAAYSYATGKDGAPTVFRGPVDHTSSMKQMLSPPVEAKYLRVQPLTWHEEIAIRLQLIGCEEALSTTPEDIVTTPEPMQCTEPLGLGADLPIESIEVSSNNDARRHLRLESARGWRPAYSTPGEWLMFDFTSPRNLTGIKTKGGPQGWVTSYEVRYTSDLSTFNPVIENSGEPKLFPANFDADSEVLNQFKMPIHARYLKILPVKWHDAIEMRVEPIGCFEPYPVTEPPAPPAQGTTVSCNVCPGVRSAACVCGGRVHYDGERCVPRDQCPCARGYLTYPVGSSFRGENCDECMCKIGGVTDCQPVKECKCAPTLVPKLVEKPSCSCVCEPCPAGTRICPTSKLCLPVVKWCDGLQDCPDDERDCATPSTTPTTPTTTKTTIEPEVVTTVVPTVAAVATTVAVTTPKPVVCPVVECPPGYMVKFVSSSQPARAYTADLPPPRPRHSYQRYYRGAKGGYSKGGYSKGGYSKGGFSKGGYSGPPRPPGANQAFTLDKPSSTPAPEKQQACAQFKCIPRLPPPPRPGTKPAAPDCSAPACPKDYTLHLDRVPVGAQQCPQYSCVPPPERPTYCNVTGRVVSTFDGAEYKYELCYHILARDTRHDAWSVLVRKKCRVDGCRNELIVHQDDQLIKVKPDLMIEYDNYEYTVEQTAKICFQRNSFDVARLGNGLAVTSRKYNFTVLFGADGDIKIGVLKQYMGFVDGLCGAFDGSLRNERRMPDGLLAASAEQMARAWGRPGLPADACSVRVASEADQKRAWDLCNVITKEPLSRCGKVLNLDKWRNICLEKICQCKDLIKNGTKRSEEECRCQVLEQLVAECLAADREADVSAWRMQMDCPAECPPPLVHKDCYRRRCEPSCSSLGVNSCPAEDGQCFPGCYCPDGMLRQGERCIAPRECRDCVCKGDGTPADYTTFEGFTFPFLGNCTYLASRDRNETGVYRYEVYATNGPCEDNLNVTCTKAIHVVYDKKVIDITRDPASKKLVTTVDKEPVFMYPLKKSWVTVSLLNGQDISVLLTDASVEVTVQQSKLELSVLVPSFSYANRTEGLCGVCAGPSAQLLTSNGTGTDDFQEYGKSWQATPSALATLNLPEDQQQCDQPPPPPPCPQPDDNPCFKLYDADAFGQCHALVDPEPFVESCEEERCAMNRSDACAPLQRYAAACRAQAVCLRWRREALCPYHCSEPLVYRPCVDCERTCENYDELAKEPAKCTAPQAEGCFCPEGKVRVNNTCIEPTKCFPCDAEKTHFAGDEWQEDACNKCMCSKSPTESSARVSCTAQTCAAPLCASGEDLVQKPAPPGVVRCCPEYMCVPKLQEQCEEPKKMECGFGQVLKQKTTANGCNEFVCECKPASSCAEIPPASEVELEPGMERVVESGGCCPRLRLVCRRDACPQPPHCPKFHELQTRNDTAKCCPTYECEPPKDKCIVSLEWEASPKGGEKARAKPEEMLKDVDETWMDGPCRWCRCSSSLLGARTACSATECPAALAGAELLVVEPRPQPYACCPQLLAVACRDGDRVYRPGENWTSPTDPCAKFSCEADAGGRLQRRATTTSCDTHCQPGWEYVPAAAGGGRCCGRCGAAACAAAGALHPIGSSWSSADRCTNYTCLLTNGTLQVQSANESCPSIPAAMEQQFVFSDEPVAGQCCHAREPTACRVGNLIYQEGQTWPSPDPCKNITCSRDAAARLTHAESVQSCARDCARGWVYKDPPEGVCCGKCVQDSCLSDDQLWQPGSTWQSADNCTTFSCTRTGDELLVSAAKEVCPDVSSCDPEDLVNDTCCQLCQEKPQALSTCAPAAVGGAESVGAVRWASRGRPCANAQPLQGFYECKGTCDSGTLYNNVTGIHDSKCECCQAVAYGSLDVVLACEGGAQVLHRVATPTKCACAPCSGGSFSGFTNRPTKTGGAKNDRYTDSYDYDVPEMYQRMKLPEENAQK